MKSVTTIFIASVLSMNDTLPDPVLLAQPAADPDALPPTFLTSTPSSTHCPTPSYSTPIKWDNISNGGRFDLVAGNLDSRALWSVLWKTDETGMGKAIA